MPKLPSAFTLQGIIQKIAGSAYIPAVGYAYVAESEEESKHEFASISLAVGKKNAAHADEVDSQTQFPASSLSKIVFTYLVLQLVKEGKIRLDEPLRGILEYERFKVGGEYPEKAKKITAQHILSHTTGLPNFGSGSDLSSPLLFDSQSALGEGYSYSGEAFYYLQQVIEKRMETDLETLAQKYVFGPSALGMKRSTFLPPSKGDTKVVAVHTELGQPMSIYVGNPLINAAGSLLTTADDFSKFMIAWLKNMDAPFFKDAFKPISNNNFTCGLGWHIYKNQNEVIAYQYGENPNTRSFIAINVTMRKGAVFFTNSANGMSIANQLLSSPALVPIGNIREIFERKGDIQNDEPGWQETMAGKIAEAQNSFDEAQDYFKKAVETALKLAPEDKSKKRRLKWFNAVRQQMHEKTAVASLKMFEGTYTNSHKDKVEIFIKENALVHQQFGQETKLVRVTKTDFLPEKDQSFKISFDNHKMVQRDVQGRRKFLSKDDVSTELKKQENQQDAVVEQEDGSYHQPKR